jgi:hypothetical protein
VHGFSVLDISPAAVDIKFVDVSLKEIYSYSVRKP